jgi:hypothetical protein
MCEWITDRLPTESDADENGRVWFTALDGSVILIPYEWVKTGSPWMAKQKIDSPEPYVAPAPWKPKRGDMYWIASPSRTTRPDEFMWYGDPIDEENYACGNCFKSHSQASHAGELMAAALKNYQEKLRNGDCY